jgi:hypothetical protein
MVTHKSKLQVEKDKAALARQTDKGTKPAVPGIK